MDSSIIIAVAMAATIGVIAVPLSYTILPPLITQLVSPAPPTPPPLNTTQELQKLLPPPESKAQQLRDECLGRGVLCLPLFNNLTEKYKANSSMA